MIEPVKAGDSCLNCQFADFSIKPRGFCCFDLGEILWTLPAALTADRSIFYDAPFYNCPTWKPKKNGKAV